MCICVCASIVVGFPITFRKVLLILALFYHILHPLLHLTIHVPLFHRLFLFLFVSGFRVSIAVRKHHDQETNWEAKDYLTYTSTALFIIKKCSDRNLNSAGNWAQKWMYRTWMGAAS